MLLRGGSDSDDDVVGGGSAAASSAAALPVQHAYPSILRNIFERVVDPTPNTSEPFSEESSRIALSTQRRALSSLGAAGLAAGARELSLYHLTKYPHDGTKTRIVELTVLEGHRLAATRGMGTPVRVLVQAASDGEMGAMVARAWDEASRSGASPLPPLELREADIIPNAAGGIGDCDEFNWPLMLTGERVGAGSFDVGILRNAWYDSAVALNELRNGVMGPTCLGGLLLRAAPLPDHHRRSAA